MAVPTDRSSSTRRVAKPLAQARAMNHRLAMRRVRARWPNDELIATDLGGPFLVVARNHVVSAAWVKGYATQQEAAKVHAEDQHRATVQPGAIVEYLLVDVRTRAERERDQGDETAVLTAIDFGVQSLRGLRSLMWHAKKMSLVRLDRALARLVDAGKLTLDGTRYTLVPQPEKPKSFQAAMRRFADKTLLRQFALK